MAVVKWSLDSLDCHNICIVHFQHLWCFGNCLRFNVHCGVCGWWWSVQYIPGKEKMFSGLKKPQERADLLAYLKKATAWRAKQICKTILTPREPWRVGTWEASLPKEHDLRVPLNNAQSLAHFWFYLPTNQSTVHYGTILSNGVCVLFLLWALLFCRLCDETTSSYTGGWAITLSSAPLFLGFRIIHVSWT